MNPMLEPGTSSGSASPESRTVPALYPESPGFREMPEAFHDRFVIDRDRFAKKTR